MSSPFRGCDWVISGLYHYRDVLLKGNPDQLFVLHADIVCNYPLQELQKFHASHRGVGTVMGVTVSNTSANIEGLRAENVVLGGCFRFLKIKLLSSDVP